MDLLKRIKEDGIAPTADTYDSVLYACGLGNQGKLALSLLREMKEKNFTPIQRRTNARFARWTVMTPSL